MNPGEYHNVPVHKNNSKTMSTIKHPRAIAALSLIAALSALLLWAENNYSELFLDHAAYTKGDGEDFFQRQLDIPEVWAPETFGHEQCKDALPIFRQRTPSELQFLKQVYDCTQKIDGETNPLSFDANIPMLDCGQEGMEEGSILEFIQSTIKKYQRIWFVGDSILGQQFNVLQCMLDPTSNTPPPKSVLSVQFDHFSKAVSTLDKNSGTYHHDPSDIFSSTELERILWGWKFDSTEAALYETGFPSILREATKNDAIVFDGGAHYNHERMHLMEKALGYIAQQSTKTNATIYYMEPTPEEWKTSNGMWAPGRKGCSKLTKDAILGQEKHLSDKHVSCESSSCIEQSLALLRQLYPDRQVTDYDGTKGQPKSPPATWRSDLARSVFLKKNGPLQGIDHSVKFVPTFWQLIKTNQTSNRSGRDCTHKSLSAVFFMNFQLMRAIMDENTVE